MKIPFLFFFIISSLIVSSQRYDNAWLFGAEGMKAIPGAACKDFCNGFVLSFEPNGLKFTPKALKMDMAPTNASICDKDGNLQCYTNGWFIRNYLGDRIDNGDTLNKPTEPNDWVFDANTLNYGAVAPAYFIPDIDTAGIYYLYHQKGSSDNSVEGIGNFSKYLLVSKLDMQQNGGKGKAVIMNKELFRQPSNLAVYTKHGNGKYWWVVIPNLQPVNYYVHLINKDSILSTSIQKPDKTYPDSVISFAQKCFSLDGSLYADCNSFIGPRVFQFDRCTGKMTLYKQHIWKAAEKGRPDIGPQSISISPNNRFLYIAYRDTLAQYDMEASDFVKSRFIIHKGSPYRFTKGWNNPNSADTLGYFRLLQHGPDGKIYLTGDYLGTEIYVINQPNEKGIACDFCARNCMSTPFFTYGNPTFPNYRLGPLKGSPCDTILGVANQELNSEKDNKYALKVSPNPATDRLVIEVSMKDYCQKDTELLLYDITGKEVLPNGRDVKLPEYAYISYMDVSKLPAGIYTLHLKVHGQTVAAEKVVVMR